ncbi:MAG: redoxin family protein [Prosthecobacter sp.]|jgi:Ca2+-binding EF-hand superfamily protein/mono/diheme cytochrome c family protein|uniref:EF-hand domain-containing protein n=1 Tax=Prosthecobacter sp. TaxID=1965333 RepID=UPI001A01F454|nr:EF-hand domain-containing protein [Prosthecobacter sp.]MBE2286100.1 redoxin family protein [Prosthecobacter sp.]
MKKTGFIFLGVVVLAISALALRAQSQLSEFDSRFKAFDKNSDGVISGDEMNSAAYLKLLDSDKDGTLTREEALQSVRRTQSLAASISEPGVLFKRLDKNADGRLTEDELPNKKWFNGLDLDKDGSVSQDEAAKALAVLRKRASGSNLAPEDPIQPANEDPSFKEAPQILKGSEHGVGRMVDDIALKTVDGKDIKLSQASGKNGLVIALFSADCPISGKLAPETVRLEKDLAAEGVNLLLVNAPPGQKNEQVVKFVADHGFKAKVALDAEGILSRALAATTTTEVFLLDASRTLIYRGALNDQYGLGYAKDEARHHYLRNAVATMMRGQSLNVSATSAPGCALDSSTQSAAMAVPVTYHRDIARIMQAHCVECHHSGGVGPFALDTYEAVIEHSGMIRKQVERGAMPPWFAAPLEGVAHSPWANDRSLSKRDRDDLLAWLASDRPKGDVADAPKPRTFPGEWSIGKPDAIIAVAKPISIKAEGTMPYQHATVTTEFAQDRWVRGYEILPSAREVVHHVIVSVFEKGQKVRGGGEEGAEGYWAAYVPGNTKQIYPEGFARKLPAGATVRFQIHYTPNGKAVQDTMRLGLLFAKEPPKYVVHTTALPNPRLNIPAGRANHVETAQRKLPVDLNAMAWMAHMHVRGKAFKFEAISPEGKSETLLDIPRYDFNWQLRYDYAMPRFLPRGTTIKITATYDNSAANPANPDPAKNVRWGQQTFDEMMIGYVEHYTPWTGR